MLSLKGVTKTFFSGTINQRLALDNVDLELKKGDFCVIIGSNGAGKSTLLNAIIGKIELDKGTVAIDKQILNGQPFYQRAALLSRVFQDPMVGTAPSMTIAENMQLAMSRGRGKRRRRLVPAISKSLRKIIHDKLAVLQIGLEDRLDTPVSFLSGGQRQSLSLIMAVSNQPKLLLLDEHTAALDPRATELVMEATVRSIEASKITTIMVTHNMNHAVTYGNRIIMMNEGRITADISHSARQVVTVEELIGRFKVKSDRMLLNI